ncbi:putative T7SS-secreted protein [Saccharopolyspora sp. MS10]|uniref:putative T7SS-secreted protein n=1 Tax=Saccharopolyspora sp. MS10 TaxID=3385973 RepID=UPI0039A083E7
MVSNTSSLGDDASSIWNTVTEHAGSAGKAIGQAIGLVDGDVIPGDPEQVRALAEHLIRLGEAFGRAADGFRRIDVGTWHGRAADAAREHLTTAPPQWQDASEAFTEAGEATAEFAAVLARCKPAAERARDDLHRAREATKAAAEAHNAQVDSYNDAVAAANAGGPFPPAPPGAFRDPAAADRAAAQQALDDAREEVAAAGRASAAAVRHAASQAPASPGLLTQLARTASDMNEAMVRTTGSILAGALDGAAELAQFARSMSIMDPYNLTHPGQAAQNTSMLAEGVIGAVANPYAAVKASVDIDGWRNDPARTLGAAIPNALASLAGGGGIASRLAKGIKASVKPTGLHPHIGGPTPGPASPPRPAPPSAPSPPTGVPQWGRWTEHSNGPHPPAAPNPAPPTAPHHGHAGELPRRPSSDEAPWARGERDHAMTSSDNAPTPAGARPDAVPNTAREPLPDHRDLPGFEPGEKFDEAYRSVHSGPEGITNDPIGFGQHEWHDLSPDKPLPDGLTRDPVDPNTGDLVVDHVERPTEFLYRTGDEPLYRKVQESDLNRLFEEGIEARHPDSEVSIHSLGAHVGGAGMPSPYVSTTSELGHALARDGGIGDDVVLEIRPSKPVVDVDATFKMIDGDGFVSHGEGEKIMINGVPREDILGGWKKVDGVPRWFNNPWYRGNGAGE